MGRSIESVGEYYDYGLRARVTASDRQKYFVDGIGLPEPTGIEDLALSKLELSRTWKDRHAKGTPVNIYDHDKWYSLDPENWYEGDHLIRKGKPVISVFAPGKWNRVATFCNFRYKQSWLENKGPVSPEDYDKSELWNSKPMGGITEW